MKVAIAASGEGLDSQASPVFGRCSHLIVVDLVDGDFKDVKIIPNPVTTEGGVGIKTARMVGNEGAEVIISGSVGPNAFEVLTQLGIKTYQMVPGTVEENLTLLSQGKLQNLNPSARGRRMGAGGRRQG
ncbi:MAG TPA: NifB/NifX family molybdenum-iron cluster-binding protein [Methanobacterium sp.]|jgi:predicted Fe-Mo cluster-binding NifX family protein|nr:NifB/NifX family molybdenum-iron cluster-binding protein [Methanobacterium sp.]